MYSNGFRKKKFQMKIPSKQIQLSTLILPPYHSFYKFIVNKSRPGFVELNRRFITTMHRRSFDPWFISGFIDAEGSFIIQVRKLPRNRTGWRVEARFKITLHKKDLAVLKKLQAYFNGGGKIVKSGKNTFSYEIRSLEEINSVVLPHFETYYLITQKKADFELFKKVGWKNEKRGTFNGSWYSGNCKY